MSITLFRRNQSSSLTRNDDIGADKYQDERRCAEQHNPDEMRVAGIFAKLAFVSCISHSSSDARNENEAAWRFRGQTREIPGDSGQTKLPPSRSVSAWCDEW
jgi:hypothetical protein